MKKSLSLFQKNLILALVLAVVVFLTIFAWFTNLQKAEASGVSVASISSLGLESSFDNVSFGTKISKTLNVSYPLISGDGTNFILPKLDYSDGSPLTDASNHWISKRAVAANQDYYMQDIYFRSNTAMNVFLYQSSKIIPNDVKNSTLNNKSDYGNFSKDYIAGAARAAFFSGDSVTPVYTWVPNEKYDLETGSNFTKITKTATGITNINPLEDANITMGINGYTASSYYLWEYNRDSTQSETATIQGKQMRVGADGYYYGAIDVAAQTYFDHAFYIGQSSTRPHSNFTCGWTGTQPTAQVTVNGQTVTIAAKVDGGYNATFYDESGNPSYSWAKLVTSTSSNAATFFGQYSHCRLLLKYNAVSNIAEITQFIYYNDSGSVGGGTMAGSTDYMLESGDQVVISATYNSAKYAVTAGTTVTSSAITESSTDTLASAAPDKIFEVVKNDNGTYAFKSVYNNKYLTITAGAVGLSSAASYFTMQTGTNGPILKLGNYYLTISDTTVSGSVTSSELTIYKGNTYTFTDNGTAESSYQYYNTTSNALAALSNTRLTSALNLTDESNILVTLAKANETDEYYTGHIRVVIWAEGTDREAKVPLANGTFSNQLTFYGVETG